VVYLCAWIKVIAVKHGVCERDARACQVNGT
jgi:hypothetical protein